MKVVSKIAALSFILVLNSNADSITNSKKLLKEAEAELIECTTTAGVCSKEKDAYNAWRGYSRDHEKVLKYYECAKKYCPKQHTLVQERRTALVKSESLAKETSPLNNRETPGKTTGPSITKVDYRQVQATNQALMKKYGMNNDQLKLFLTARTAYNPSRYSNDFIARNRHIKSFIKDTVQYYIEGTESNDYTQDGYIKAIADLVEKTPAEILKIVE